MIDFKVLPEALLFIAGAVPNTLFMAFVSIFFGILFGSFIAEIVCEEGGKRHDERLGKDDPCESAEGSHAHGDGCFILAVVYGTESAADIFRLIGGVI